MTKRNIIILISSAIFIFIVLAGLVIASLVSRSSIRFGRDTPARIGASLEMNMEYAIPSDYGSQFSGSDAIAEVVIREWIGEDAGSYGSTYFKAVVIDCLKGDLKPDQEIIIKQNGSSRQTINGFPLFKNGSRMLIFLTKIPHNPKNDMVGTLEYTYDGNPNLYTPLRDNFSILDIAMVEGVKYAGKRFMSFDDANAAKIMIGDDELKQAIRKRIEKADAMLVRDDVNAYPEFYRYFDIAAMIRKGNDFNFIFNFGVGAKNEIDTKSKRFTKDMIMDPSILTDLTLTADQMNTIYAQMKDIDIMKYPEVYDPQSNSVISPVMTYTIRIQIDGKEKNITWEDKHSAKTEDAIQLRDLFQMIMKMITDKAEFKALPESRGGYA